MSHIHQHMHWDLVSVKIRLLAILFGGAMCALSGAYMSILLCAPMWQENMTAGRGWIALALSCFCDLEA